MRSLLFSLFGLIVLTEVARCADLEWKYDTTQRDIETTRSAEGELQELDSRIGNAIVSNAKTDGFEVFDSLFCFSMESNKTSLNTRKPLGAYLLLR